MRNRFLCVAHPSEAGGWEAFCLDFDIAVHAGSFEDVKRCLEHSIHTYLVDAMNEDEPHRSALLNRRAPLYVRAAWGLRLLKNAIFNGRRRNDNDVTVGFPVTCQA